MFDTGSSSLSLNPVEPDNGRDSTNVPGSSIHAVIAAASAEQETVELVRRLRDAGDALLPANGKNLGKCLLDQILYFWSGS